MTVIAFRDGVLAADTQCTFNGVLEGRVIKIAKRKTVLAAVCGKAPQARAFLDWFRTGMKGDCPNLGTAEDNAWGFIYPADDQVLWFKPGGLEDFRTPFHATGSGSDYAMGAMGMGADAVRAVEVAAQFCTACSLPVTVLRRAA